MQYQITRGGQSYGPYTLSDLQRYVASGHILLTDLAKSEEMTDWVPVSQILNPSGATPAYMPPSAPPAVPPSGTYVGDATSYVSAPSYPPAAQYPDPPNLNWGLVLLFDCLTCGVFQIVWNLVVAAWMKRVQPASQAIIYYAVGYALVLVYGGFSIPLAMSAMHHSFFAPHIGIRLLGLIAWIVRIFARFSLKASLEEHFNTVEPINLRLNGVLVFFFGGLYIQSELNRINQIKQAMRYRDFAR